MTDVAQTLGPRQHSDTDHPDRAERADLVVASVPAGHVYVRHIAAEEPDGVVRLDDPDPDSPQRSATERWWPPVMLDPTWIEHHDFDVFHVQFGFDAWAPEDLRRVVETVHARGRAFVYTAHDLRNPHHAERGQHDAQLAVLMEHADAVLTLTPGAAEEIARRVRRRPGRSGHRGGASTAATVRRRRPPRAVPVASVAGMSRPLDICLIASSRFPVREPFMGGLEAHTHALAEELLRRGHRVSLFAAPGSDPALGVRELPLSSYTMSAAGRADVGYTSESWMEEHHAYLGLMLALARGDHGRFDVIHNNSLHHLPVAMSGVVATPVVTTLHTPPLSWLESAVRFAAPGSRFVAVSRCMSRAWAEVTDTVVIHNGVDTDFWHAGNGGGGAVWSGRLVPEKAPHEALDAAARAGMPIALSGPVHDQSYYEKEIAPRLGDRACYVGHLDRRDLRRLVAAASVAVVTPQWEEPFGLVAAEAMSCGTPVAAYDRGALNEIVDDASGVLVAAGDVDALASAMVEAQDRDRDAVRRRVCRQFSRARMVDDYEVVYQSMARLVDAA
ncbi:glycosyltransferase [Nocardioides silvaticus]|nr:glycosyltransferase [Nocardioides silvaticus]